jgi:hypothetical protein
MRYYLIALALFFITPAYAQVTPQPAGQFLATPCSGAGFLAPRTLCSTDLTSIGTTGTGSIVLSASPTVTGQLRITGGGTNANIYASDTGTATSFTTAPYNFFATDPYGSFASASTHFEFVVQATKAAPTSNTTGSRIAGTFQQLGSGGTGTDYFTGGYELVSPTAGSFANAGNFTGNSAYCNIPTGMNPTSCVGQETNVSSLSNVTNIREGDRIVDIGSTGSPGAGIDAAFGGSNAGGIGFQHFLFAGDAGNTGFPVPAGGDLFNSVTSSVVLNTYMNFANISGVPALEGVLLPAGIAGIGWGTHTTCCGGGEIISGTSTSGGKLVFANGLTVFQTNAAANVLNIGVNSFYGSTTAPVVTACGTTPATSSGASNSNGTITEGTTSTGCTLTFSGAAHSNNWDCVISYQTAVPATLTYSTTTTALVIAHGSVSSPKFTYHCMGG